MVAIELISMFIYVHVKTFKASRLKSLTYTFVKSFEIDLWLVVVVFVFHLQSDWISGARSGSSLTMCLSEEIPTAKCFSPEVLSELHLVFTASSIQTAQCGHTCSENTYQCLSFQGKWNTYSIYFRTNPGWNLYGHRHRAETTEP